MDVLLLLVGAGVPYEDVSISPVSRIDQYLGTKKLFSHMRSRKRPSVIGVEKSLDDKSYCKFYLEVLLNNLCYS